MADAPKTSGQTMTAGADPTFDAAKSAGKQIVDWGKLVSGYAGVRNLSDTVKKVTQ